MLFRSRERERGEKEERERTEEKARMREPWVCRETEIIEREIKKERVIEWSDR